VFSDYARPSLRLAGLMKAGVVYQFTHDSIGVGEDGPTHQPVEHLAALRTIPNWTVIRPCDANETREAWRAAMLNAGGPTALACSRQNLPVIDRTKFAPAEGLHKGAYVLSDPPEGEPEIILMATGSEVAPTLEAARLLAEAGRRVRTVSFPSWELFEQQPEGYRRAVLPPAVRKRIAVEAGRPMGWERYVWNEGEVIGLPHFGESGPGGQVMKKLGFSAESIVARAQAMLDS
jgi:transketolase